MNDLIYIATNSNGYEYQHYDRDNVFNWYENNKGVKLVSKTKDLFPTINIICEKHIDVNNLREDDTLNNTSVALRKAVLKYDKKNTKQIKLKLNKETDKDILEFLENEKAQTIIKELIRKEIKKRNKK